MKVIMHTKDLGKIGEAAVIQQCLSLGVEVFIDFGDNSRIDLILNTGYSLERVQVKCYTPDDGKIVLELHKSGPSYNYKYKSDEIDWFAVVNAHSLTDIAWINAKYILDKYSKKVTLRISPTKNNQASGITWFRDFQDFPFNGPVAQ